MPSASASATLGFFVLPGLGLDLRGIAALNACLLGAWTAVAWRLRTEYVRTIHESIRQHRIDSEQLPVGALDLSTTTVLGGKLVATDPTEVRYALTLIEGQQSRALASVTCGTFSAIPRPRSDGGRWRCWRRPAMTGRSPIASARCCAIPTSASEPRRCSISHAK